MAVTFKGTSLLERNCLLPAKDKCGRTKQDQARRHIKENLARACQEQGASESLTLASLVFWRPGSPCCPSQATPFNPHSCSLWHLKLRVPPPSGSKCVNTAECQMYGNRQGKAIKSISSVISVWVRRLNTHSTTRRNPCLRSWGSKCTRSKLTYWGREGGASGQKAEHMVTRAEMTLALAPEGRTVCQAWGPDSSRCPLESAGVHIL